MMKLWLIWQDQCRGYDTYDSAVVAAESEERAKAIHPESEPGEAPLIWPRGEVIGWGGGTNVWCGTPDYVQAKLIGEACEGTKEGVILASFNAG